MKISDMVKHSNRIAGNGAYNVDKLIGYFDECIDMINEDLNLSLPLVSEVYANNFDKTTSEEELTFEVNGADNEYTRVLDPYIRNYICYESVYRLMRDEDEDYESYGPKQMHADRWYTKLLGKFSDYTLEDTESITIGGDVDDTDVIDDTGVGFYNPMFDTD